MMRVLTRRWWAGLVTVAGLAAGPSAGAAEDVVILDETAVKNLGIETVEVEETDFEETIFALGRIEVLPGRRAVVSSRIPGRVRSVIALPDMRCEEGDELVWVESRQPGDPPPVIRLDAPMSGIIARVDVAPGQPVSPDDSLVEIHDLSTVEATAAVPEHLAGKLAKDLVAHIRVPGFPDKTFEARLAHLGAEADRKSGTLEAAFHVPNPDGTLRPGMRAEFSIVISRREGVMSVPRNALQGDAARRFVYVVDFDLKNAFVRAPVEVGQMNDRSVEIVSGVLPGDTVVTRGAYSLAFAGSSGISLKDALDAAHGHEHNPDGSEITPEQKNAPAPASGAHEHDHDQAPGGSSPFWLYSTVVLFGLLVLSVFMKKRERAPEREAAAVKSPSGKEVL